MNDTYKVYVGDVGTIIEIDMGEDLADVSDAEIRVQKPDASEVVWIASIDGQILYYETGSGDLDIPGRWILQPFLRFSGSSSWEGQGDAISLEVYPDYSLD